MKKRMPKYIYHNDEDKMIFEDKKDKENKDNFIRIEVKKINDILNKNNEKLKHNFFLIKKIILLYL